MTLGELECEYVYLRLNWCELFDNRRCWEKRCCKLVCLPGPTGL